MDSAVKLACFVNRPSMFVPRVDRDNITSFLHGFDVATPESDVRFTARLSEHIEVEYRIVAREFGWCGQVADVSVERGQDWVEAFQQFANAVLRPQLAKIDRDSIPEDLHGLIASLLD